MAVIGQLPPFVLKRRTSRNRDEADARRDGSARRALAGHALPGQIPGDAYSNAGMQPIVGPVDSLAAHQS